MAVSFESLFTLFLEYFQAASYGDPTFSLMVMVPMAQKYNVRWRLLLWSENQCAVRFLRCEEADVSHSQDALFAFDRFFIDFFQLFGTIDDYLQPIETDVNMLKSYYQAISSSMVPAGSVLHRIATHHLTHCKLKFGPSMTMVTATPKPV